MARRRQRDAEHARVIDIRLDLMITEPGKVAGMLLRLTSLQLRGRHHVVDHGPARGPGNAVRRCVRVFRSRVPALTPTRLIRTARTSAVRVGRSLREAFQPGIGRVIPLPPPSHGR